MEQTPWPIKCISLSQPHATLVAVGAKSLIVRDTDTGYRGPLAIHAASGWRRDQRDACKTEPFRSELRAAGVTDPDSLPRGAVVALVDLKHTWSTDRRAAVEALSHREAEFDDWRPGRWAWYVEWIRALPHPQPLAGQAGLWTIDGNPVLDSLMDPASFRQRAAAGQMQLTL